MGKYVLKRVLLLIPTIFLVCLIVFALMRAVPGDAVDSIVTRMTQSGQTVDADAVRHKLGLDVPAAQQFFNWLADAVRGNLGDSFFQFDTVSNIIARQLPVSLELGILTLIFANLISIPLGLFCAAKQDSIPDYTVRIIAVIFMAIPVFWLATLVLFYPAQWWDYSPPVQYVSFFEDPLTNLQMFLIPSILGALAQAGMQLRIVRTMVLDTMRQDYIRTAYAKGVNQTHVMFQHAFRNSMIPVITVIGFSVGALIGGNVVLENIFNIPGIGQLLVTALGQRDYPVVQGSVLVMSIFVMIVNLIVDIAYKWIDPRIKYD
ncbi:MAG: glutathione transporter permease [Oscillospiraceae bacterium]|nr:glutathione transporter permease [Oscillospiraceae bacterium]